MPDHTHLILGWLIAGGICCVIGAVIGMEKGQAAAGFFYGLLLGPLGLLFIAVADDQRIQCPVCRELINRDATVCPKCLANMAKLRHDAVPQGHLMTQPPGVDREPPRVIPKVARVAGGRPRVVSKATRAVAKVTQALEQVTQALGQMPNYFIRKPLKVVRTAPRAAPMTEALDPVPKRPRAVVTEPPRDIPHSGRVVVPEPPTEITTAPREVEAAPRFFLYKPEDEVRGPFDLAQIQALMECGVVTGETQFCREGDTEWKSSLII